ISENKKGRFDYQIHEDWEAGLALQGDEIKAIRAKKVVLTGSYIKPFIANGQAELWWVGGKIMSIGGDPTRTRKLLMHRQEINRIIGKLASGNFTVLPLELYLKHGRAKLKIALGTRKSKKDNRETIKKRDIEKNLREEIRQKKISL
ncbi:MAG: SsrA-binding protein SmpB, partial [Patescibacteria group bacterium]